MLSCARLTGPQRCGNRRLQGTRPFSPHVKVFRRARHRCTQSAALPQQGLDHLLLDSTLPVLKIGLMASTGAVCAHYGMLNAEARRALSRLAINVFTPALMITKLGAHTDLASALSLWYIGANVILCHFVGLGLGMLHTRLLPTPHNLKHIIHVSSAIANTGNLPLVLVLSLIKSPDLPFNSATQADMAVSYIMLGWWYATLVQMPLGTLLLHKPARQPVSSLTAMAEGSPGSKPTRSSTAATWGNAVGSSTAEALPPQQQSAPDAVATLTASPSYLQQLLQQAQRESALNSPTSTNKSMQQQQQLLLSPRSSRPQTPSGSAATLERNVGTEACSTASSLTSMLLQTSTAARQWELASAGSNSISTTAAVAVDNAASSNTGSSSSNSGDPASTPVLTRLLKALRFSSDAASNSTLNQPQQQQQQQQHAEPCMELHPYDAQQQWDDVAGPLLKGVLSAPLIAGIVAISIGCCPPLQEALFSPRGSLSIVGDILDMLGQPLIPVLLLVLGANLSNGPQLENGVHLPAANVAGIISTKLVLSPMLGLAVVLAAQKIGLVGPGADPLAVLVMMVTWSTPTAILVHPLSLVHQNGEDEVSALLFYEYLAAAVTLPLCSAVYLYVLGCCVDYVA